MVDLKDGLVSNVTLLAPRAWFLRLDILPFAILYIIGFLLIFLPENEEVVQVAGTHSLTYLLSRLLIYQLIHFLRCYWCLHTYLFSKKDGWVFQYPCDIINTFAVFLLCGIFDTI